MSIQRRTVLTGTAAVAGGAVFGGPFQGFVAAPAAALGAPAFRSLRPVPDLRDGVVRLHLPEGFSYRSFHDTTTPVTLDDGTVLPGRHDGMAAFAGEDGRVTLVRNHEVNGAGPAFGPVGDHTYDPMAQGGCTVIDTTLTGEVEKAWTGINGTQMNCSGGPMPWGTWVTCEETVNGPDVGPDFTGASNVALTKPHGFVFEVPTTGSGRRAGHQGGPVRARVGRVRPARRQPLPQRGQLRLPLGLLPLHPPDLTDGVRPPRERRPAADAQGQGRRPGPPRGVAGQGHPLPRGVGRHRRPGPDLPLHAGPDGADGQRRRAELRRRPGPGAGRGALLAPRGHVLRQRRRLLHLDPGRRRGHDRPQPGTGYGNGSGQVWGYDTRTETLFLVYQSPAATVLDFPDNITQPQGHPRALRGQHRRQLRARPLPRWPAVGHRPQPAAGRTGDEFAGSTFSPDGHTLFVNIQASRGMTFAIWGPWERIGV